MEWFALSSFQLHFRIKSCADDDRMNHRRDMSRLLDDIFYCNINGTMDNVCRARARAGEATMLQIISISIFMLLDRSLRIRVVLAGYFRS